MLKAIIFDMDGVIAETEIKKFAHIKKLAEAKGNKRLDEKKHLRKFIGMPSKEFLLGFFGKSISKKEIEDIVNKRRREYSKFPEKYINEMKGIRMLSSKLAKKYILAIASGAQKETVMKTISHLGILGYFKIIVTGSEIKKNKPNPEIYLRALKKMNLKSDECLAVEDSETGIAAAKGAGIRVIGKRNKIYEEFGYKAALSKADFVIDELEDLPKILGKVAVK